MKNQKLFTFLLASEEFFTKSHCGPPFLLDCMCICFQADFNLNSSSQSCQLQSVLFESLPSSYESVVPMGDGVYNGKSHTTAFFLLVFDAMNLFLDCFDLC